MDIQKKLLHLVQQSVKELYAVELEEKDIQIQTTRKEIVGDFTVVVFPFLRYSKKSPELTAQELGSYLQEHCREVAAWEAVNGFLNLVLAPSVWLNMLNHICANSEFGLRNVDEHSPLTMVEYSSPNTNKPLHLGHIRNNLLGYSVAEILKANGHRVVKTNIVNDRGIHICKSMVAWKHWGEGRTPESTGIKGDHLVGDFYVKFDQENKKQIAALIAAGKTQEEAEQGTALMQEAREMLRLWEAKDTEVYQLWKMMNEWVYAGFDITYKAMGVDFDKIYYESETYLEGKEKVLEGLRKGVFEQHEDGSVWADLTGDGLDKKILLRSDGTSVYMTQDIGTAKLRFDDYAIDNMVYVVGNEQNYHFQVLSLLLDKLGFSWGKDLKHFSYGMVELPEGKMKSREGTVVDADDLLDQMIQTAEDISKELGKLDGYSEEEARTVYRQVALGALKYYILKVDPRKTMTFDPKESIDFNGNTGPFLQYAYARTQSVIRKAALQGISCPTHIDEESELNDLERHLIQVLSDFRAVIREAGKAYSPALIANYCYELVKEYNFFYHEHPILKCSDEQVRALRLTLTAMVARTLKRGLGLLGMEMPERM